MKLFIKKPLSALLTETVDHERSLKRTLGAGALIALGIGAIIGAGLFVRTAAAAGMHAGPAVTISFIVAALGCALAGLCYAEFASMIPIAGSAYTYAYATMGELVAWIIGWALVLEYALGAATVSIAWSEYLNNLVGGAIPWRWCHSPFESVVINGETMHGFVNLPAVLIIAVLTLLLIRGTHQSAIVNAIIVFIKVAIVLVFIAIGFKFINTENLTPYFIPADAKPVLQDNGKWWDYSETFNHGFWGVMRGAAVVFFAFIGFDAVSTAAQEAKNPKRDMPIGILGSLAICTILYILFSHVLTGVAPYTDFLKSGKEASVTFAIKQYMPGFQWLGDSINIAILAGFSSVMLVMLMGQSRVFFSMSHDGLLPKSFSALHHKYKTPYKSNLILLVFVGLFGGFLPGSLAGDLTSIGTLFAFALVSIGVLIMRRTDPHVKRPFKTPLVPYVPIAGALVCLLMIMTLDVRTQMTALIWMAFGLMIYFGWSIHHSKLRRQKKL